MNEVCAPLALKADRAHRQVADGVSVDVTVVVVCQGLKVGQTAAVPRLECLAHGDIALGELHVHPLPCMQPGHAPRQRLPIDYSSSDCVKRCNASEVWNTRSNIDQEETVEREKEDSSVSPFFLPLS